MRVHRATALAVGMSLLVSGCRWDGDDGRDHNPDNQPAYARPGYRTPERDHTVRGPVLNLDGVKRATFDLVDGADVVHVRVGDLGGTMYEVSTPRNAKSAPAVDVDDYAVTAALRGTGRPGPTDVTVLLSDDLRWSIRLSGGAATEVVDLSRGPGGDVHLAAGTSTADVALPADPGTQTVTMSGGASRLHVRLTGNAPVRVAAAGGAGVVTVDGTTHNGVAGGSVFTPAGWSTTKARYDINATAGVGTLSVDRIQ